MLYDRHFSWICSAECKNMNKTNSLSSKSILVKEKDKDRFQTFQIINALGDICLFRVCEGGSHLLCLGSWRTLHRGNCLLHLYLKGNKLSRQRRNQGIFQAGGLQKRTRLDLLLKLKIQQREKGTCRVTRSALVLSLYLKLDPDFFLSQVCTLA